MKNSLGILTVAGSLKAKEQADLDFIDDFTEKIEDCPPYRPEVEKESYICSETVSISCSPSY